MTKLIIGCGYVGRRVARSWLALGARVMGTTRSLDRAREMSSVGIEPIIANVLEPESLRELPAVSTVLYAVGLDRGAGRSMREVYVQGLANVLAALPCPKRLIYVSSTSVYAQRYGEEVDETAATEPLDESAQVVLEAEQVLRATLPEAIILRFAGIYGPDRLMRREALLQGEPVAGDPDQWLNLIQVDDGVAAILAAEARADPGEIYNVSDNRPVRRRDFYSYLAKLVDAPAPRFDPSLRRRHETNRRVLNGRLRKELGVALQYPSFEEGLPAAIKPASSP